MSGGVFAATSIVGMILGSFVLGKFAAQAHDPKNAGAIDLENMPEIFARLIENRFAFILLCLPALLGGVLLMIGARPKTFWYLLGLLGILLMIGTLMGSFLFWIAPLYQYQEL